MSQAVIWLVEDEAAIADTLVYTLEQEGFIVRGFDRGLRGNQLFLSQGGAKRLEGEPDVYGGAADAGCGALAAAAVRRQRAAAGNGDFAGRACRRYAADPQH